MITMSILVLLSSTAVGDDGDMRWSNNDLQSVANTGGRLASRDLHCRTSKRPSKASVSKRDSHSTVPEAVDIAWLSPPSVELTARGSL